METVTIWKAGWCHCSQAQDSYLHQVWKKLQASLTESPAGELKQDISVTH